VELITFIPMHDKVRNIRLVCRRNISASDTNLSRLAGSSIYGSKHLKKSFKDKLYQALETPKLNTFDITINVCLFLILIINIGANIAEIFYHIDNPWVHWMNTCTVIFFTLEFSVRFALSGTNKHYRGTQGKLKFLRQPYTIIDMLALLPSLLTFFHANFVFLRLLRFLVFLRLFRMVKSKKILQKFVSIESFAAANMTTKILILMMFSFFFIDVFQYAYTNDALNTSLSIFLDPPALVAAPNGMERFVGIVELILGLLISGTLISIITSLMLDVTEKVKKGLIPYRGKNHMIIMNNNPKLPYILDELECFYHQKNDIADIVLLLPNVDDFERFKAGLNSYQHLDISCVYGDPLNIHTYQRVNLEQASGLMMLLDEHIEEGNKRSLVFIRKHFNIKHIRLIIEATDSYISNMTYDHILHEHDYLTVNHHKVLAEILNRSIVDYRYFPLYSQLFSFEQHSIFMHPNTQQASSFYTLHAQLNEAVFIGIHRDDELIINPKHDIPLTQHDQLIYIALHEHAIDAHDEHPILAHNISIPSPSLIEDKKVCFVGSYNDFDPQAISGFLSQAIHHHTYEHKSDLFCQKIWEELKQQGYDVIILNLEDQLELDLMLYLRGLLKDDKPLLSKIVSIINDPVQAELLVDPDLPNHFILSEKIVAQYLSLVFFHKHLYRIFDEFTTSKGSELYIIDAQQFTPLLHLDFPNFKYALLQQGMMYFGCYCNQSFAFNSLEYANAEHIVVIAEGAIVTDV